MIDYWMLIVKYIVFLNLWIFDFVFFFEIGYLCWFIWCFLLKKKFMWLIYILFIYKYSRYLIIIIMWL